jgi:hypothetical protein
MLNLDQNKLQEIVEKAFNAAGSRRWEVAIVKAKQQIESNPYMHFDGDALLILSPESSEIYRANGTCQCKAFTHGQPCWHRAAARLVKRYNETSH